MFAENDARMKSDGTTLISLGKAWERAKKSSGQGAHVFSISI
jgi:hypothetical protein